MISLQAIISLVIILILVLYWVVAFLILYHLTRFGVGVQPKRFAATFFIGSVILFTLVVITLARLDLNILTNL